MWYSLEGLSHSTQCFLHKLQEESKCTWLGKSRNQKLFSHIHFDFYALKHKIQWCLNHVKIYITVFLSKPLIVCVINIFYNNLLLLQSHPGCGPQRSAWSHCPRWWRLRWIVCGGCCLLSGWWKGGWCHTDDPPERGLRHPDRSSTKTDRRRVEHTHGHTHTQ